MSGALSICVLIPAYNARLFLREALDSVHAQTRPPEQIIVIDDGSTDGTADVALAWQAERGRSITLIRQANGGQSAARNAGIRAAREEQGVFAGERAGIDPGVEGRAVAVQFRQPVSVSIAGGAGEGVVSGQV